MTCKNTTNMYLNLSTDICASGSASRSGTTVTISGTFSVEQSISGWNTNAIYATVSGKTGWIKVKDAGNVRSGTNSFTFSFTDASAGSATYTAVFQVFNSAETGGVGNQDSVNFTVSWPAGGTAPSDGYVNGLRSEYNPANNLIEFSASSAGVASSLTLTTLEFVILKVPYNTSGLSRQAIPFTNNSSVILNQENSTAVNGGITIQGNDLYYVGISAANSIGSYRYNGPSIVSVCEPASFSVAKASNSSVTVTYSTKADGGAYNKLIEYSIDNGANWITGATVSSSSATTGTFTVSYLNPETTYTMLFRIRTQAGTTGCSSLTFSLLHPKFYGPVSDLTEKANMLYGSLAHLVASSYTLGSQDLITSFDSAYLEKYAWEEIKKKLGFEPEYPLSKVDFTYTGATENIKIEVTFSDNSKYTYYDGILDAYAYILSNKLGCRGLETTLVTPPGVDLTDSVTMVTTLSRNTKLIKKLYASENGRAKLIYKENL